MFIVQDVAFGKYYGQQAEPAPQRNSGGYIPHHLRTVIQGLSTLFNCMHSLYITVHIY